MKEENALPDDPVDPGAQTHPPAGVNAGADTDPPVPERPADERAGDDATDEVASSDLAFEPGQKVGSGGRYVIYRIHRVVRSKGKVVSEIYRAEDVHGDRDVAIKVALIPSHTKTGKRNDESSEAQRALREALVGHRLATQPDGQFALVFDHFYTKSGSGLAIVMTWLGDYKTLGQVIRDYKVDREGAARVAEQLGALIGKLRQRGIRHRDIKPDNLFVPDDKELICVDYGRANDPKDDQQTDLFNQRIGTAPYMSPHMLGRSSGNNGDEVFAMAATVYELLAGVYPRAGTGADELLTADLVPLHEQRDVLREAIRQHRDRSEEAVTRSLRNLWEVLGPGLEECGRYAKTNDPDLTAESFGRRVGAALHQCELEFEFPLTVKGSEPRPGRDTHHVGPAQPSRVNQSPSVLGADRSTENDAAGNGPEKSAEAAADQPAPARPPSSSTDTSHAAAKPTRDHGGISSDDVNASPTPLTDPTTPNERSPEPGAGSRFSAAASQSVRGLTLAARATLMAARTASFSLVPRTRLTAAAGLATLALAIAAVVFLPSLLTRAKGSSLLTTLRPRLRLSGSSWNFGDDPHGLTVTR